MEILVKISLTMTLMKFAILEEVASLQESDDSLSQHGNKLDSPPPKVSVIRQTYPTRIKRQEKEPPKPVAYNPGQYEGFWYDSVWWLVETVPKSRCMATFISLQVAITPCECVVVVDKTTYVVNADSHEGWIKWYEEKDVETRIKNFNGQYLHGKDPENFHLESLTNRTLNNVSVTGIYTHEGCRSFFKYNFALVSSEDLDERYYKVAWVHSPEDILFRSNMKRVQSALSVLGHCKVPWVNRNVPADEAEEPKSFEVYFQSWPSCRPIVCREYSRMYRNFREFAATFEGTDKKIPYVKDVCDEHVADTKMCTYNTIPVNEREPGSCHLPPGVPVYCDVDRIQGVFGFFVSQTFGCSGTQLSENSQLSVFQPLDVGIEWMKKYLGQRLDPNYPSQDKLAKQPGVFPSWIWGLKKLNPEKVYDATTTRQGIVGFEDDVRDVLEVFANDQAESVVNVYEDKKFSCQGVQISPKKIVVPCFCVYKMDPTYSGSDKLQWGEPQDLKARQEASVAARKHYLTTVRLAKYDNFKRPRRCRVISKEEDYERYGGVPNVEDELSGTVLLSSDYMPFCYETRTITKSEKCDGAQFADFALIETNVPIQFAKNAWIHTSNVEYFQKTWTVLPEASLIERKCYFSTFEYMDVFLDGVNKTRQVHIQREPIVFAPFELCTPLLCDPDVAYQDRLQQEFCFNQVVDVSEGPPVMDAYTAKRTRSANQSRECIKTSRADITIWDGTPIFCELDELRGLIGIVSRANMPGLDQTTANSQGKLPNDVVEKTGARTSVIIVRFDGFLDEIKESTIIYQLENSEEFQGRSGSHRSAAPTRILLFATCITSVQVLLLSF